MSLTAVLKKVRGAPSSQAGLALVEVIMIMGVISFLACAALFILNPGKMTVVAQDRQRQTDLRTMAQALDAYAKDHNGQYPVVSSGAGYYSCYNCGWASAELNTTTGLPFAKNDWIPELVEAGYIASLPTDPLPGPLANCSYAGYIYLSGGKGYKLFSWCGPRTDLNSQATAQTYCGQRPPYDGSALNKNPSGAEPLKDMVDPARPAWGYAVYTYELACF